jgi:hypothetical protein
MEAFPSESGDHSKLEIDPVRDKKGLAPVSDAQTAIEFTSQESEELVVDDLEDY